jgi:hypothetical protein
MTTMNKSDKLALILSLLVNTRAVRARNERLSDGLPMVTFDSNPSGGLANSAVRLR